MLLHQKRKLIAELGLPQLIRIVRAEQICATKDPSPVVKPRAQKRSAISAMEYTAKRTIMQLIAFSSNTTVYFFLRLQRRF